LKSIFLTLLLIATFSPALNGSGLQLVIANHSFENPAIGDGGASSGVVDWTTSGTTAIMNPTDGLFPGTTGGSNIIDGFNAVAINFGGRASYQVSGHLVRPNTVYTLSLLAGRRADTPFGNGTITLWAGTNLIGEKVPTPPAGGFSAVSLIYTSPPAGPTIGKALLIEFYAPTPDSQIWFDDVHLSFEDLVCTPHKAIATAQLFNGIFVGGTILDTGCGYSNAPNVTIQGGGGEGATATAVIIDGRVSELRVRNGGCCYTNLPTIIIESPPRVPTVGIKFSKVKVTQNVTIGRRYVLESSFDMSAWTPVAPPFVASSEVIEDEFDLDVTGRYFRVREEP
jgi:hypothetical protein